MEEPKDLNNESEEIDLSFLENRDVSLRASKRSFYRPKSAFTDYTSLGLNPESSVANKVQHVDPESCETEKFKVGNINLKSMKLTSEIGELMGIMWLDKESQKIIELEKSRVNVVRIYSKLDNTSVGSLLEDYSIIEKEPVVLNLTATFANDVGQSPMNEQKFQGSLRQSFLMMSIKKALAVKKSSSSIEDDVSELQSQTEKCTENIKNEYNYQPLLNSFWDPPWFQRRHVERFNNSYRQNLLRSISLFKETLFHCMIDVGILEYSRTIFTKEIARMEIKTLLGTLSLIHGKYLQILIQEKFRNKLQRLNEKILLSNQLCPVEMKSFFNFLKYTYDNLNLGHDYMRNTILKKFKFKVVYHSFLVSRDFSIDKKFMRRMAHFEQTCYVKIQMTSKLETPMSTLIEVYFDAKSGKYTGILKILDNFIRQLGEYVKKVLHTIAFVWDDEKLTLIDTQHFLRKNNENFKHKKLIRLIKEQISG